MQPDLSRAQWRKSNYSGNSGNCIEVACNLPYVVAVRDSKDADGAKLIFSSTEWRAFVHVLRGGPAG